MKREVGGKNHSKMLSAFTPEVIAPWYDYVSNWTNYIYFHSDNIERRGLSGPAKLSWGLHVPHYEGWCGRQLGIYLTDTRDGRRLRI